MSVFLCMWVTAQSRHNRGGGPRLITPLHIIPIPLQQGLEAGMGASQVVGLEVRPLIG
jgi:hypothetical protein